MRSEAWRPAAAARNRSPREAREVARQALRPGCEELAARIRKATARRCRTAGAQGDGSAAPRPKIAAVERREASVLRHKRVHARLDALWDARRLARRLACGVIARPTGAAAPERFSALRSPSIRVSEARMQNPGRKHAP